MWKKFRYTRLFLLFALSLFFLGSCKKPQQKIIPTAVDGVMDLRDWDFEKDGNINLVGEWEFFYKGFINSGDFDNLDSKFFLTVPGLWDKHTWKNEKMDPSAFGTYRLRIIVNPKQTNLALKIPNQATAYELFLNDSFASKNGTISQTKDGAVPQYLQQVCNFSSYSDTINVVFHVSNYHYREGGIWKSPVLGNHIEIQKYKSIKVANDFWLAGVLFLFTFVVLVFYFYRKEEKISLYFGFFGLVGFSRVISTGEIFITSIFPDFNWELLVKLELFPLFISPALIALITYALYKEDHVKWVVQVIIGTSVLAGTFNLLTPAIISSHLVVPYYSFCALCLPYFFYVFFLAIKRKREGALLLLFGFLGAITGVVLEILFINYVIDFHLPSFFGISMLLLVQIILLAGESSRSFKRIENFALELEETVKAKTQDLSLEKQKTEKLLLNILPQPIAERLKKNETLIVDHFEEASVIFVDLVGFTQVSEKFTPRDIVLMLNEIFIRFDQVTAKYGLEKIKTIGDCYMAASGIPSYHEDHAESAVKWALEISDIMKNYQYMPKDPQSGSKPQKVEFRIGLNCGPVVAGVIGEKKFIYDLWGDTVNIAARMQSYSLEGKIHCSEVFKNKVYNGRAELDIDFVNRGELEIKGKGKMKTSFIIKRNH
jgi:class 3 adenylate cyclase